MYLDPFELRRRKKELGKQEASMLWQEQQQQEL
jgi:hypothetical protein